jgi:hypothetical protein
MRYRSNICKIEKMQELYALVDDNDSMGTDETSHDTMDDKDEVRISFTYFLLALLIFIR